jgi:hypothetical protein
MYGDFSHMHILEDLDGFTGVLKVTPKIGTTFGHTFGQLSGSSD